MAWRERPSPAFYAVQPVLPVAVVGATVEYDQKRLGFEVDFLFGDPPEYVGLVRGEWSCDHAYLQIAQANEPVRPQGWLYFMVEAENDELHAAFASAGVDILRSQCTYPWGMRENSIRDLNGYELRFGTRPAA